MHTERVLLAAKGAAGKPLSERISIVVGTRWCIVSESVSSGFLPASAQNLWSVNEETKRINHNKNTTKHWQSTKTIKLAARYVKG